ncbi:MAG: GNAT family N-acetyltransferase [Alphaproteobacteria bacterium]|jgi:ribosomal-protein-alanine N-acetyltransferase|nr:GNAT family N-acetyltransferase [Rhodobiaceae bacterium]MBO6541793.1 GNAT family N-acetyltransferase [Alphaproteobacteria bacterium]MBO6628721.1 GNAT family N-acetyltransferase [Alphaproteobacteria bacterium]MDF1625987.1 GNAT family N-acetyltransferase [Parvibaculaceae bacterium]|tara:strand:+ start:2404 stop:2883 length:480 start_codon:yes stop_codon:yes gene_type:complete
MDHEWQIRAARPADVPMIGRIWHDSWQAGHADFDPEIAALRDLPYFMARAGGNIERTLVGIWDGRIWGFTGWEGDGVAQVFVAPSNFRRGLGSALLAAVEDILKEQGHEKIWLHCLEGNERARSLYEKHGWSVAKTIDDQIGTHIGFKPVRSWHMEKRF